MLGDMSVGKTSVLLRYGLASLQQCTNARRVAQVCGRELPERLHVRMPPLHLSPPLCHSVLKWARLQCDDRDRLQGQDCHSRRRAHPPPDLGHSRAGNECHQAYCSVRARARVCVCVCVLLILGAGTVQVDRRVVLPRCNGHLLCV